ncbi:LamG domain-containing protein [Marinicauda algicola]|uniref:LamG domain-containing protein n=1 Tax=Marinicauda algicola TaxID=2029849 RepID=A0A4S2H429_9PROT|nr:LamG-like jellyroll fold domain-containing protein [Marinicauda algicola]TGY90141.1 LamG domain-containing protein [Marinicauda algicola]
MRLLKAAAAALTCLSAMPIASAAIAQECTPPPDDMLFWFAQDGQMSELIGNRTANGVGSPGQPADPWSNASAALSVTPGNSVEFASDAGMQVGAGDFTVDAWIRTSQRRGVLPIVDKRNRDTAGYMFYVHDGRISMQTHLPNDSYNVESQTGVANGEWRHVAATIHRRERAVRLYVDGQLVHTGSHMVPAGASLDNNVPLRIGRGGYDERGSFDVDEVELFDRALSPNEIAALARAPKCKRAEPPRGYDLTISKEPVDAEDGWQIGTQQSFEIVVQNQSGSASFPNGAIVVQDNVPANFSPYSVSWPQGSGWTCQGGGFPCTYEAVSLGAGDTLPPLTVTATVGAGDVVSNCASVRARLEGETNRRNNEDCARVVLHDRPVVPPVSDPCCPPGGGAEVASVFQPIGTGDADDPRLYRYMPSLNPGYGQIMQAYADYVILANGGISSMRETYSLKSGGNTIQTGIITYQNGSSSASGTFFTIPLQVNTTYRIERTVTFHGANGQLVEFHDREECGPRGIEFVLTMTYFRTAGEDQPSERAVLRLSYDGVTRDVPFQPRH